VTLKDNAPNFLSDSRIDRDDAVAFYKGLIRVRGILKKWRCLLWVEPGNGKDGRFRFTFPRTSIMTDYRILESSGVQVALPSRCIEAVLDSTEYPVRRDGSGSHIEFNGKSIPVCGLNDLAAEEIDGGDEGDHIAVLGLAEKRLGVIFDGTGRKVEGIKEQLTDQEWAGVAESVLHIGEYEYPVLDAKLVLEKYGMIQGFDGSPEESGFSGGVSVDEDVVEDRISRV
jgi:hypothetical protein